MVIRIPLPAQLPDANSVRRWHWTKRWEVSRDIKNTAFMLALSARQEAKQPPASQFREVSLVLCRAKGQRILDADNAITAMKPIVDGLKAAGLIVDDSPKWVSVAYAQERRPEWRGVIVEVK